MQNNDKLFKEFFTTHTGSPSELLYKFKHKNKQFVFNTEIMHVFNALMRVTVPRSNAKRCDEVLDQRIVDKLKITADRAVQRHADAVKALADRYAKNKLNEQLRLDAKAKKNAKSKVAVDNAVSQAISGSDLPFVMLGDVDLPPIDVTTPIKEYTIQEKATQPVNNRPYKMVNRNKPKRK